MFGYPICWDAPICFDTLLYVWMPPYVWKMFGCLLYMYNTNLSDWGGFPYDPHTFGCPHMFGHPNMFGCPSFIYYTPCMFGCPIYLDNPLYVWMPSIFGHPPVCLDAPICLEALEYLWILLYVWMSPCTFGRWLDACCTYTTQRKHALSDWGGVLMPPYIWMPPILLGCPVCLDTPHVWMSLIPLDATIHLAASKHTVGQPNIWWHLNIQGASKHTGGIQIYGGIWTPP